MKNEPETAPSPASITFYHRILLFSLKESASFNCLWV
jgi:hypothetical protein